MDASLTIVLEKGFGIRIVSSAFQMMLNDHEIVGLQDGQVILELMDKLSSCIALKNNDA